MGKKRGAFETGRKPSLKPGERLNIPMWCNRLRYPKQRRRHRNSIRYNDINPSTVFYEAYGLLLTREATTSRCRTCIRARDPGESYRRNKLEPVLSVDGPRVAESRTQRKGKSPAPGQEKTKTSVRGRVVSPPISPTESTPPRDGRARWKTWCTRLVILQRRRGS